MNDIFTQTDSDNLADIIWWIKGYWAGSRGSMEECPFDMTHYESLRKARILLKKEKEND